MGQIIAGGRGIVIVVGGLAVAGMVAAVYLSITPDRPEQVSQSLSADGKGENSKARADASSASDSTGQDVAQFDVVRVDPDGTTVVAGTASPGARVTIMVDETAKQSVDTDASGQFVALLDLPHSDAARVLTLNTTQDGQSVSSHEQMILAPSPALEAPADTAIASESAQSDTNGADSRNVAVLRADSDGVEMVLPSTPGVAGSPDTVALDTITYDDDGRIRLGGRAKAGSRVRVYLDNTLSTDLTTDADGRWQTALEGIDPGLYTLRLDEISGTGDVISRVETPLQREKPEVLKPADPDSVTESVRAVTVQQGDTLWAISRDRFGEGMLYLRVFDANREAIRDPDLIYPGQVFAIPD